jgi:hypothetical protein
VSVAGIVSSLACVFAQDVAAGLGQFDVVLGELARRLGLSTPAQAEGLAESTKEGLIERKIHFAQLSLQAEIFKDVSRDNV